MHSDEDRIVFEDEALRVVLLPGSGGRIESLQGARVFAPAIPLGPGRSPPSTSLSGIEMAFAAIFSTKARRSDGCKSVYPLQICLT